MSDKKTFSLEKRVRYSIKQTNKLLELFNNKYLLTTNTNLSSANTKANTNSNFNTINSNKIKRIKLKSAFSQQKEKKMNIKKIKFVPHFPKPNNKNFNSISPSPYDTNIKKNLRGKICKLMRRNIILCESKFHPRKYTESISNVHVKEFKNRFKNFDDRFKVGIFTNRYPSILNVGDKFYSRYFDYFTSPDEILSKNFTKQEIFQIKTDPGYYNIGGNFNGVNFFKKKKLKDILNEEEKIGINNIMEVDLKKSLDKTKRKIKSYLNYYTSVMSRRGFIHN